MTPEHGTRNSYLRCLKQPNGPCTACRAANAAYHRAKRHGDLPEPASKPAPDLVHGTYGAYQRCRKRPEGACPICKRAAADYHRDWRMRNADRYEREKVENRARRRALWRLAGLYPDVFQALVGEELAG